MASDRHHKELQTDLFDFQMRRGKENADICDKNQVNETGAKRKLHLEEIYPPLPSPQSPKELKIVEDVEVEENADVTGLGASSTDKVAIQVKELTTFILLDILKERVTRELINFDPSILFLQVQRKCMPLFQYSAYNDMCQTKIKIDRLI